MKACKHNQVKIIEVGTWYTTHFREKDGSWTHDNEPGDYTGKLLVTCPECDLDRVYYTRHVPRWLETYLRDGGLEIIVYAE